MMMSTLHQPTVTHGCYRTAQHSRIVPHPRITDAN
jgi:hypothetical protein